MIFENFLKEDIRLVVLMLLSGQNNRTLNEHLIQRGLEGMGHALTLDQVRTEVSWLKDQRLVKYEVNGGTWVATVLRYGEDAANGTATVPGVQHPGANEE